MPLEVVCWSGVIINKTMFSRFPTPFVPFSSLVSSCAKMQKEVWQGISKMAWDICMSTRTHRMTFSCAPVLRAQTTPAPQCLQHRSPWTRDLGLRSRQTWSIRDDCVRLCWHGSSFWWSAQPTVSSSFNKIAKSKRERVNHLDCALDLDAIATLILADLSNNLDLAFVKHTLAS